MTLVLTVDATGIRVVKIIRRFYPRETTVWSEGKGKEKKSGPDMIRAC
jgi:hypothetical protein